MVSTVDLYDTDFLTRLTIKRLAELNKTRAKVESLEKRTGLLAEFEVERRKLDILNRLSEHYATLSPQLHDMSGYVSELKQYLQGVYDADLMGDAALQSLTTEHCLSYTVRLMDLMADASKYSSKGSLGVLELATSTLAMFSQRPSATDAIVASGAVPAMVRLLSPLYPAVAVVNVANTVGNLAGDVNVRLAFRAGGGVGALVRLLRSDVESSAQTAAAAALSLLAARDVVIQDSVRYLGGIDLLVGLLASEDSYLSEVARYCLLSLRHGNVRNQSEIISSLRASTALAKDIRKLDAAAELLRFEEEGGSGPLSARRPGTAWAAAGSVRGLIGEMDLRSRPHTADSYSRASAQVNALRSSLAALNISPVRGPAPAPSLLTRSYDSKYESPASRVSGTTRDYATASVKDYNSLLPPTHASYSSQEGDDWKLGTLIEVESELLRKKHLARFSSEEVCMLLEEMGFDKLDLRGFRAARVTGADLLDLREEELAADFVLPRNKVRKVRALQQATRLFDRISTLPRQGKLSEVEVRLYLAGQGAGAADVNKVIKLLRTLVRTDRYDFITFWDFVTSYDWVQQALKIYNVPT
mmetsp:Transcript_25551/g.55657  ORF Transcript_25551/g.55657 Transcript_25551/m.55657 type:complete len:586 (-) Transcript_25551:158-1915(-)|eukprot:CAMPEP_0202920054 /NCGR_PEP_ID=MMETSP1392-20130828/76647_1 /ASSEMBLY_ACC=CAM_ASM_000868 /TAXON_ID=225041 /ORGANISM="Chlamydomonas chlamydogama, Strain SAG 11-48b" /LENGTH=585 /DNA_ID=CAMNT_0049613533 /DNA_START=207 /DNA_END=1964 /DNA_ORIENTATION=-